MIHVKLAISAVSDMIDVTLIAVDQDSEYSMPQHRHEIHFRSQVQ